MKMQERRRGDWLISGSTHAEEQLSGAAQPSFTPCGPAGMRQMRGSEHSLHPGPPAWALHPKHVPIRSRTRARVAPTARWGLVTTLWRHIIRARRLEIAAIGRHQPQSITESLLPQGILIPDMVTQPSEERKVRNGEGGALASLLKAAALPKTWNTKDRPLRCLLGVKLEISL